MSKFILSFIFAVLIPLYSFAAEVVQVSDPAVLYSELALLDNLIEVTTQNLKNQKELRSLVLVYQAELAKYLKNSTDKDLVMQVAKTANKVLTEIKKNHLLESFQVDFISELTIFSQLSQKKGIPRP